MDHARMPSGTSVPGHETGHTAASCGIAFMAKASVAGRAKTRLVPPLTYDEAAALNTAFLQDVAANLLDAARLAPPSASIAGYAAYCPSGSESFFGGILPSSVGLINAALAKFGVCLSHTLTEIFARGHHSAVVLNADSPTLPTALLNETAAVLAQPGDRAVLGPSCDGGYYLLGVKTVHARLFEDIAWSTERVAEQTVARAHEIGLELHRLPMWYDIDDVESLRRLHGELDQRSNGNVQHGSPDGRSDRLQPHHPSATAALWQNLLDNHNLYRRIEKADGAARTIEREPDAGTRRSITEPAE